MSRIGLPLTLRANEVALGCLLGVGIVLVVGAVAGAMLVVVGWARHIH